jgi:hypothetical protein
MSATNESHRIDPDLLDARIQALAQELQDEIFSFAFLQIPISVFIDKDYKPPMALQLNRKLRARFAKAYYANVMFMCKGHKYERYKHYMAAWASQLEKQHRDAIQKIHYTIVGAAATPLRCVHGRNFYRTMAYGIQWAQGPRRSEPQEKFRLVLNFVDAGGKLEGTLEGDRAYYFRNWRRT